MIGRRRRAPLLLLSALLACAGDDGATSGATSGASTATGDTGTGTGTTDDASSSGEPGTGTATTTGVDDGCRSHAVGEWNACKNGPMTDNNLCNAEGSSAVVCLQPASGGGNVCSLTECVDVCDCFAPPATGTAVVTCAPILANGNACALFCAGGQTCPDGMGCKTGYCYWLTE